MTSLLMNSKIMKIDIIAIQKSYCHKNMIIMHCSWSCNFWSVYLKKKYVKIYFLINKKISSHNWNVKFIMKNLAVLIIQQEDFRLNIMNIYSSSLKNYNHMIDSSSIHHFQKILNWSDKHILVSDLNLHYKNWKDNQINKKHKMTADLFKHVKQSNLILITFISMMIYNFYKSKIIINLIFISLIIHD